MKSIFITGIAGMLGANLAYLLRMQYLVSGVDLNPILIKDVNSYVFSAFDIEQIKKLFIFHQVDTLIHCAALVNVDECEICPDYADKINHQLTKDLTQLCASLNITMIFISTDAVFDGKAEELYRETDTPNPISIYGKTKLRAEQAVLELPSNLVVRTNIYGFNYRDKSSFGEWILNSLRGNTPLNMFYDIYFSPILVNELAEILSLCMKQNISGLYHIGSTGSISKFDMAVAIREEFNLDGSIHKLSMANYPFKAPRTRNMGLNNEKITNMLDIVIRTPTESVRKFKQLYDVNYPGDLKGGA
jgi:dTDP-4-dehydrorhamnose reductase